jgi:hypothetical protein
LRCEREAGQVFEVASIAKVGKSGAPRISAAVTDSKARVEVGSGLIADISCILNIVATSKSIADAVVIDDRVTSISKR